MLALQGVRDWAMRVATREERDKRQERGLKRTADYCQKRIEELDPDGSVRQRVGKMRGPHQEE